MRIFSVLVGLLLASLVSADSKMMDSAFLSGFKSAVVAVEQLQAERNGAVYSREQLASGFEQCRHLFPGQKPIDVVAFDARLKVVGLCSDQFATLHSGLTKTPLVVVERLNASMMRNAAGERRSDDFFPDPRIQQGARAELVDYFRSGYDRGHMSPAANQIDQKAMIQSFSLSNMVPQHPDNNRGPWAKIESDTRKYTMRAKGDVFVFSGPLFDPGHRKIGGGVWVPTRLFKLVYDANTERAWAFILPNAPTNVAAPITYANFVVETGWELLGK